MKDTANTHEATKERKGEAMGAATTITRRTRNLGMGWSNDPVQDGERLTVRRATTPDFVGTYRQVQDELGRATRLNSGNDWRRVLFVGNRPIVGCVDQFTTDPVDSVLMLLAELGQADVYLEEG